MAQTFLEIKTLIAVKRPGSNVFEFEATLDGPTGVVAVPLPVECLLDYTAFQKLVLERTGLIIRFVSCEGRDTPHQNENWHQLVQSLMTYYATPAPTALAN